MSKAKREQARQERRARRGVFFKAFTSGKVTGWEDPMSQGELQRRLRILGGGAADDPGKADLKQAAAALGVSAGTARRYWRGDQPNELTAARMKAFSDPGMPATSATAWPPAQLVQQLHALGGTEAGEKIDYRKASKRSGVNQNTLRRWVAGTQKPSPAKSVQVAKAARQLATTQAGRRSAISPAAKNWLNRKGKTSVQITAFQGPIDSGAEYFRERTVAFELKEKERQEIFEAYLAHGDDGAWEALKNLADRNYLDGWDVGSWDGPGYSVNFL